MLYPLLSIVLVLNMRPEFLAADSREQASLEVNTFLVLVSKRNKQPHFIFSSSFFISSPLLSLVLSSFISSSLHLSSNPASRTFCNCTSPEQALMVASFERQESPEEARLPGGVCAAVMVQLGSSCFKPSTPPLGPNRRRIVTSQNIVTSLCWFNSTAFKSFYFKITKRRSNRKITWCWYHKQGTGCARYLEP